MTHYLRMEDGLTLVDVEAMASDIRCFVSIRQFSRLLLQTGYDKHEELINDFSAIQEIRGDWFEVLPNMKITTNDLAKRRLSHLAEKWDLQYVTD